MPDGARPAPPAGRRDPSGRSAIHRDSFEKSPLFLPFPFYWAPTATASAPARLTFSYEQQHKDTLDGNSARPIAGESPQSLGTMAGAASGRVRPAQSQCHGAGDRGRSRLSIGP